MVAFNIGNASKGEGFEDGHVMNSAVRGYIWLKMTEVMFLYTSKGSERKTYLKPRGVSKTLDHGYGFLTTETQAWWHASVVRIDPATMR